MCTLLVTRVFGACNLELSVELLDGASEARSQAMTGVGWWRHEDGGDARSRRISRFTPRLTTMAATLEAETTADCKLLVGTEYKAKRVILVYNCINSLLVTYIPAAG